MATKTKRWAFGVVGLGNISDFHAEAANEVRGGTMYACYSRSPEKAATSRATPRTERQSPLLAVTSTSMTSPPM